MGALIIGQVGTIQNMYGMDSDYEENRSGYELYYGANQEDVANEESWSNSIAYLWGGITNLYSQTSNKMSTLHNNTHNTAATVYNKAAELKQNCKEAGGLIFDNAVPMKNKPVFRLIPGIGLCDALSDGARAVYSNAPVIYNNIHDKAVDLYSQTSNQVSTLYNTEKPIKAATKATIDLISWSKPVTYPAIRAYCEYNYLSPWIAYPLLTWQCARGIQSMVEKPEMEKPEVNIEPEDQALPGIASAIFSQISEGAQESGINAETMQAGVTTIKTFLNPTKAIKNGYELGKSAAGTIKNDLSNQLENTIKEKLDIPADEPLSKATIAQSLFVSPIRSGLNIPADQEVNLDTVIDKLTGKFKTELEQSYRNSLNIPADQAVNFDTISDKLTGKFKTELEQNYRAALNIPADQPVNVETITKKIVEEPLRKVFNLDPEEEVTADAVMRNIAKNTVYRFGIPVAALVAATPIVITAGYFGCKYVYHRLTTEPEPPIFMESSEKGKWQNLKNFTLRRTEIIPELAYSEELEKTFDLITRSSINAFHEIQGGNKNIFYEPVLMYGPPGTGKTAKAKQMIKQIYQATDGNMQWRVTNGSMLLKAGQHGINKMFDWLNKQPAACLFIDEADTLFPDRDEMEKYPERLEIVNHLLSLIGERSNKFMIIMTTNRLGAFDDAMARRIDNLIHIPLPNEQGRNRVLKLYRDNMLLNQQSSGIMKLAEKHCPQLFENPILTRKK